MMLEKIYDKYNFDEDYEVYKYGQQVLIFNSVVNIFMFILGLCLHEGLMTSMHIVNFAFLFKYLKYLLITSNNTNSINKNTRK